MGHCITKPEGIQFCQLKSSRRYKYEEFDSNDSNLHNHIYIRKNENFEKRNSHQLAKLTQQETPNNIITEKENRKRIDSEKRKIWRRMQKIKSATKARNVSPKIQKRLDTIIEEFSLNSASIKENYPTSPKKQYHKNSFNSSLESPVKINDKNSNQRDFSVEDFIRHFKFNINVKENKRIMNNRK